MSQLLLFCVLLSTFSFIDAQLAYFFMGKSLGGAHPFNTECETKYYDNEGVIQSPNYPDQYAEQQECVYIIDVAKGKHVLLRFDEFKIEDPINTHCAYDKVTIYMSENYNRSSGVLCGAQAGDLVLGSNKVLLHFKSDRTVNDMGFNISYVAIEGQEVVVEDTIYKTQVVEDTKYKTQVVEDTRYKTQVVEDTRYKTQNIVEEGYVITHSVQCGFPNTAVSVNGNSAVETNENEFPWIVQLRVGQEIDGAMDNKFKCGATIIHESWVVSAAHCFEENRSYSIMIGQEQNNPDTVDVETVTTHPDFNKLTSEHDIALVKLSSPLQWKRNDVGHFKALPICLTREDPVVGTACLLSGWGKTKTTDTSAVLLKAVLPIEAQDVCYGSHVQDEGIFDSMMCSGHMGTGGIDACAGDSVGPLMCKSTSPGKGLELQGVMSIGKGCGYKRHPGILTRAARYIDWINMVTGENF